MELDVVCQSIFERHQSYCFHLAKLILVLVFGARKLVWLHFTIDLAALEHPILMASLVLLAPLVVFAWLPDIYRFLSEREAFYEEFAE